MSETSNPFDPEAFATGGGLWDGKTVTITSARTVTEALKYGDGKPVLDAKTGQPSIQTALKIKAIADGGDDKERSEDYSAGDKTVATPDGEGFVMKDGSPLKFHANSNIARFSAALKTAGFDIGTLVVRDANGGLVMLTPGTPRQQFSKLVGARFTMKGVPKLGKDGKPTKDKKGYDKNAFYPVKFVGYAQGAGVAAAAPSVGGNGAAGGASASALEQKAVEKVTVALAAGPLSRADLVRTLAQQLAGDADANGIIGLVVQDAFHQGKPWKWDNLKASL